MHDSYYMLPPALRERRVYRAAGTPATEPMPMHGGIDSPELDELDLGGGGVASTARHVAVFLQMMLNRGSYGNRRILSPASAGAMTRIQFDKRIPQILPWIDQTTGERINFEFRGGGFGFGFHVVTEGDRYAMNGSLGSPLTFGHLGNGGIAIWADHERELLGVFLSVSPRYHRGAFTTNSDLFQNAVNAAIVD